MADLKVTDDAAQNPPLTLLSKLAISFFGAKTRRNSGSGVTDTKVQILVPANPNRVSMTFTNNSDATIFIGFTPDVTANNSIITSAVGGGITQKFRDEGNAIGDPIYGFATVAGKPFSFTETELWGA